MLWIRDHPNILVTTGWRLLTSDMSIGKGEVCPKSECLVVKGSEGLVEQADGQLFWLRAAQEARLRR
jgi:hypothetical protein